MIIITGADSKYLRCLRQFLASLLRIAPRGWHELVVWDLGLTEIERKVLRRDHPEIQLRSFRYDGLPDFVRPERRTCAWKPILLQEIAEERAHPFLWLDSATVCLRALERVESVVAETGLYTPYGGAGTPPVHPTAVAYMEKSGIDPAWAKLRTRAGGVCAFDPRVPAVKQLIDRWKELSLVPECIAPPGSSLRNHKYEQAILTMLLYQGRADGSFTLTTDELDISASRPVDFLITRAKVAPWVPMAIDPVLVGASRLYRHLDAALWRLKRRGKPTPSPDHPVR